MSLWFRKHGDFLRDKMLEVSRKTTITSGLGTAIKNLQQHHIDSCLVYSDNLSDNLCYYLEAIFIHGLKDNFFDKVSIILSNNTDKLPDPNFWPFLMVFSHKDILFQINNLSQINSDVGRCRALIRIALNEGLIESYLAAMIQDKSTVRHYYKDYSYLRDPEQPEIMKKYIEGLRLFDFKLACNSRMLNVWSPSPLILSGLWSPPIVPEPVFKGIDAASFFDVGNPLVTPVVEANVKEGVSVSSEETVGVGKIDCTSQTDTVEVESIPSSVNSCPDPMPPLLYDEVMGANQKIESDQHDITVEIILDAESDFNKNFGATTISANQSSGLANNDETLKVESKENDLEESNQFSDDCIWSAGYSLGNRITGKDSWSSSCGSRETNQTESESACLDIDAELKCDSYQELLQNYSPARSSILRTPDFQDLIAPISSKLRLPFNNRKSSPSSSLDESDFVILPKNCSYLSADADQTTQELLKLVGKIAHERGLDSQNYQCKSCGSPIGMIYGKARLCNYDGFSYCQDCHENEESCIPARIIHNWDFKKYKVSKLATNFFQQIEDEPLVDIRQLNSHLYSISPEMKEIQLLRTQLNYLRSYLFTCRESVAEEMRRKMWPRDYMYEHIHLYSFKDLMFIQSRSLAQQLQKVVTFASKHVTDCELCRQKGFICEICQNPKVIYPFELGHIFRCETCLAVYHSECMADSRRCPKCERIRKRDDHHDCNWSVEP
ncbi:pleckstrin y domain containing, M (with RUN domain) member 1 [Chamberlinius hualienensis]